LTSEIEAVETRLAADQVRVCFGGRKLLRATRNWEANGYADQAAATAAWRRKRSGSIMIEGDRESSYGNPSLHVILDADAARDGIVRIRLPHFVTGTACWMDVPASGFTSKQNRAAILAAQERTVRTDRRRGSKEDWDAGRPIKVRKRGANPVSVRLTWNEAKAAWYAHATVAPEPLDSGPKWKERGEASNRVHVLAQDLNTDHVAWALVDPSGNPVPKYSGRIEIEMGRKAGATISSLGAAVSQIMRLRAWIEEDLGQPVALAAEILDFQRSRSELRDRSPELAAKLSSFAYNRYNQILDASCRRDQVELRRVGAGWSSVLGHLNYAHCYGVSVDIAAAIVLGRRALGMQSKIRPSVQARVLARDENGKGPWPARVTLDRAKRAIGPRRETWKTSSPLLRRQALAPPTRPLRTTSDGRTIPDRGATLADTGQRHK
jgi:hypothetical protein